MEPFIRESTAYNYRLLLRQSTSVLGTRNMRSIKTSDVPSFLQDVASGSNAQMEGTREVLKICRAHVSKLKRKNAGLPVITDISGI